jgi:hypothetical protein
MTLSISNPRAKSRWTFLTIIVGLGLMLGIILPMSVLAAPPKITLEQCRNGAADDPNDCLQLGGGTGWQNGNSGASTAHFVEGHSIPYRAIITAGPTGTNTVQLGYDIKHSGANAIDFLTHFDRLLPHAAFGHAAEAVDPTDGVSGLGGDIATCDIPLPSNLVGTDAAVTFAAIQAANKDQFTVYGASSCSVVQVEAGDLGAAQSEARVDVTFNATSATVVLAWGGHIAKSSDWDGNGAAAVSGSPYHMRLKAWTAGNVGNQDRSLSAAAVLQEVSTISTQPNATLTFSASLTDSATVTGDAPTGTVQFRLFTDNACTAEVVAAAQLVALPAGTDNTKTVSTSGFNVTSAGTWYWTAVYSGDEGNEGSTSGCTAESVTVTAPTFSTVPAQP